MAALIGEKAFRSLKTSVTRLTEPDTLAPAICVLQPAFMPQAEGVASAVRSLLSPAT